ncbi:hypothetical protein IGA_04789 [Bacillus cereus HuA3-9]|uniref:Uncharacterized protein n=1 Tax=Bacillus cereus HuA3-9 TaxID=1053205 RepID=R8CMK5_BACCE|nr:hypothetical protein IGA_04789 [Bacillus cereus HuA3-9]
MSLFYIVMLGFKLNKISILLNKVNIGVNINSFYPLLRFNGFRIRFKRSFLNRMRRKKNLVIFPPFECHTIPIQSFEGRIACPVIKTLIDRRTEDQRGKRTITFIYSATIGECYGFYVSDRAW